MAKEDHVIARFQKSGFEEVRATIGDFKGKTRANVRVYADYDGEDEYSPTKKGISLKLEDVGKLKKLVDALDEAANEALAED
jgi:Transcriptional Coactivator p15 (PC4)